MDGAIRGTDRGDGFAFAQPGMSSGGGEHIERIRRVDVILGELARRPEQPVVALALLPPRHPRRQPRHIRPRPDDRARRASDGVWSGVEEVRNRLASNCLLGLVAKVSTVYGTEWSSMIRREGGAMM